MTTYIELFSVILVETFWVHSHLAAITSGCCPPLATLQLAHTHNSGYNRQVANVGVSEAFGGSSKERSVGLHPWLQLGGSMPPQGLAHHRPEELEVGHLCALEVGVSGYYKHIL